MSNITSVKKHLLTCCAKAGDDQDSGGNDDIDEAEQKIPRTLFNKMDEDWMTTMMINRSGEEH